MSRGNGTDWTFPTFRQIQIIESIAQHGTIGQAADALHLSQPAVTRALQNVEDLLRVRLFDRTPNGVIPTVFAEPILKRAPSLRSQIQEAKRQLSDLRDTDDKTLNIGGGPHSIEIFGHPAVAKLAVASPDINISARPFSSQDLVDSIRAGDTDIGVSEAGFIELHDDLEVEIFAHLPVYFVIRSEHPLAILKQPTLADIVKYPLIGNKVSPVISKLFGPDIGRLGQIDNETGALVPAIRLATVAAIKHGLLASDALALMPQESIAHDLAVGQIVALAREIAPNLVARMCIVTAKSRRSTRLMRAFRNAVLEVADRQRGRLTQQL